MQLNHDYFLRDCKVVSAKQTNARYKNFTQLYYTAGDVEQFWSALNLSSRGREWCAPEVRRAVKCSQARVSEQNVFNDVDIPAFEGYANVSEAQVEDTFNYIFQKFKKGIYVKIRNCQLHSFIPFSKASYTNEWSDLIKIDPQYGGVENFFKAHHNYSNQIKQTKYKFDPSKINFDPMFWYANNCILRYENPINEGDTNYAQIKSMLLELCAERQLPDIDFFINRRDFPLLTKNGVEPYDHMYGDNVPLKSYKFDKYIPILSMCSSDQFADIAIPTHEDWGRVKSLEGVFFPQKCRNYKFNFNLDWATKKNLAVFRGSNTGCGYNAENNTRLKLAKLGLQHPRVLDVGITNWNLRVRKNKDSEYLQIPRVDGLRLVNKLSPEEQSNYKFLINVDGHVSAFRLSLELSMGCCILLVHSTWKMWFSDLLKPYVHYVPVAADLSNLIEQIQWCRKNDDKCKKIAQNALQFYKTFLLKKGIFDYLQKMLIQLHSQMYPRGQHHHVIDPLLCQSKLEHKNLTNKTVKSYKLTGLFPKNLGRNYGVLKAFEMFIDQSVNPEERITLMGVEVDTIFKSKTTRVVLYQIGSKYVVAKKTLNSMKKIEFIHEAFIGKRVINNLLKSCPNFVFVFNYRDEPYITYDESKDMKSVEQPSICPSGKYSTVLQEFVHGPTLQEFLKHCSFKAYLEILISLSCALLVAQKQCGFVHHDLKPWNIIVTILPEPVVIDYHLRSENTDINYKLKTRYVPVIIDYGKSHVILENVHYGVIEPFNVNRHADFVTLITSTVNELVFRLKRATINREETLKEQDVLHIANFVSASKINTVGELQVFLRRTTKFGATFSNSNTLTSPREIEHFFKHVLMLRRKHKVSFGQDTTQFQFWSSNSKQLVDMGFALSQKNAIHSYLDVVRRIYKNPMPQATNRFTTILIAQKIFDGISIPKMEFN